MTSPSPARFPTRSSLAGEWSGWFGLALQHPGEALEPGEVHARRKCCPYRNQEDPEQPCGHAHLIPGVAPRCDRQRQGGPGRNGPLLGNEVRTPGLPCTISVPNL